MSSIHTAVQGFSAPAFKCQFIIVRLMSCERQERCQRLAAAPCPTRVLCSRNPRPCPHLLPFRRILGQDINKWLGRSGRLDLSLQNLLGINLFPIESLVRIVILVQGCAFQLEPGKHSLAARVEFWLSSQRRFQRCPLAQPAPAATEVSPPRVNLSFSKLSMPSRCITSITTSTAEAPI
jgi:hypothetical protein